MKHWYLAVLIFTAFPAMAAPLKNGLVPHKALYDIKLTGTKSGSQVLNITGQMLYEWQETCDAWISNHRFNILYEYADSPAMRIASDFSTYEPFDGKSIDFTSQRKKDGAVFEMLRGHAALDEKGAGKADYTTPEDLQFDLPAGTKFPAMHTMETVDAIRENKKFFNAVIFDGGDEEGPVEVNAFIGKMADLPESVGKQKKVDMNLLKPDAHKIRLAFFPLGNESESSDYEMSLLFHDNGVISDMAIDYDDFSVSQKLVALEPLKSQCKH
ncbi:MAG: EipB family protein [Alphaproteobacteria bacterium]